MKTLFLWASVILVCYFASNVARVPTSTHMEAGVPAAVRTIGQLRRGQR
jgi:hypothetical protein